MILVAGGTGTLGTRLVARLTSRGAKVRVLTRDPARVAETIPPDIDVAVGDVRHPEVLSSAMTGVDTVISAVQGFAGSPAQSPASVDRDGNRNLMEAAAATSAAFVLMSVVGASKEHPIELFRMKHAAEERLRATLDRWTIVRSTAFLETWVAVLQQTARGSGRPLVFGRGINPINFVSAVDVAALVERLLVDESGRRGMFEIGGPADMSFDEMARAVQNAAGTTGRPRHVPRGMLRTMSVIMKGVKPELARQAQAALVMDTRDMTFDASPIRAAFPDLPTTSLADVLSAGETMDATP
jgi:uncharacterized protein YbjT (DUF2867 family)